MSLELYVIIAAATCFVFTALAAFEDPDNISEKLLGVLVFSAGWPVGIPMAAAIYIATFVKHIADHKTEDPQ